MPPGPHQFPSPDSEGALQPHCISMHVFSLPTELDAGGPGTVALAPLKRLSRGVGQGCPRFLARGTKCSVGTRRAASLIKQIAFFFFFLPPALPTQFAQSCDGCAWTHAQILPSRAMNYQGKLWSWKNLIIVSKPPQWTRPLSLQSGKYFPCDFLINVVFVTAYWRSIRQTDVSMFIGLCW